MTERSNPHHTNNSSRSEPILPGDSPPINRRPRYQKRAPSLFWPIALIGFGVLLLLSNLGLIPATGWAVLWRIWPIALVALGLDVLIGRRSVAGAIASGVVILLVVGLVIAIALFAEQIPILVELAREPTVKTEQIAYPLDAITAAEVTIDYSTFPGYLSALGDSGHLIEADIAYEGELIFNVNQIDERAVVELDSIGVGVFRNPILSGQERARWEVKLASGLPINLTLDGGSGSGDYDLTNLNITHLKLDAGSGSVTLTLPQGSFDGSIDGSSGKLTLIVPSDVGLRLTLDAGSGRFHPGERLGLISGDVNEDSVWATPDYENAITKITLNLDQGSGSIYIR
jgi:hypothetical protein